MFRFAKKSLPNQALSKFKSKLSTKQTQLIYSQINKICCRDLVPLVNLACNMNGNRKVIGGYFS